MKPVITMGHPDTVSGTTVLDDGTKVYWTEGYSEMVVIEPNGEKKLVGPFDEHPVITAIDGSGATRPMTTAEEVEWITARQ